MELRLRLGAIYLEQEGFREPICIYRGIKIGKIRSRIRYGFGERKGFVWDNELG